jgi:hypothetical protein
VVGRSAIRPTLEVAGLVVALAGLATGGSRYLANYGEHSYSCIGKPTPCLSYSRVDDPGALVILAGLAGILILLLGLAVWRVRHPSRSSGVVFVAVGLPLSLLLTYSALLTLDSVFFGPPDSVLIAIIAGVLMATATASVATIRPLLTRW